MTIILKLWGSKINLREWMKIFGFLNDEIPELTRTVEIPEVTWTVEKMSQFFSPLNLVFNRD